MHPDNSDVCKADFSKIFRSKIVKDLGVLSQFMEQTLSNHMHIQTHVVKL